MSRPVSLANPNTLLPRLAAPDRLIIALFFAAVMHIVLILGIRFDIASPKPKKLSRSLDITLITRPSEKVPEKADFLAQDNQTGDGNNKKKAQSRPASITVAKRAQPSKREVAESASVVNSKPIRSKPKAPRPKPVLTQSESDDKIKTTPTPKRSKKAVERKRHTLTASRLSRQIAEVGDEYSRSTQQYAKRQKIIFVNSVNAHKYKAAAYERAWQNKVERIGNLNFPEQARRKKLSGNLLLSVGIKKDGTIYSIEVRRSSGHKVLDDAAIGIVRLAAPFAPFPEGLRDEADVLVITRTWKFFNDSYQLTNK